MKIRSIAFATLAIISFSLSALARDPIAVAEDARDPASPALAEAIASPEPGERARAALALGRIQKPEVIAPLFGLLSDFDLRVKREAIFALGQLGWKAEFAAGREAEISARLAPLAADPELAAVVVEALGKVGLENTPALVAGALADPAASVRREALLALYRHRLVVRLRSPSTVLPDLPEAIFSRMTALAADADALVVRDLAFYFGRVKDNRAEALLIDLLASSDTLTRYYAVAGLRRIGRSDAALAAVLFATKDAEYSVRAVAVDTVNEWKEAARLDDGLLALDASFHVRAAYARALAGAGNADALVALFRTDPSPTVKADAFRGAIAALGDSQAAAWLFLEAMASPHWVLREAAVDLSGALGTGAEDLLFAARADASTFVRALALTKLAAIPGERAYGAIREAIAAIDANERGEAATALVSRSESDAPALAWRGYLSSPGLRWAYARGEFVKAIAKLECAVTTQQLLTILEDPVRDVALLAKAELERRGIASPEIPADALTFTPYAETAVSNATRVVIETTRGSITLRLFPDLAPVHSANFVALVRRGYFNSASWYRVVSNFVVQGGDHARPAFADVNDYSLRAENSALRYGRGTLGAPRNDGFDTANSDIFISHMEMPHLNGQYTVFGEVVDGLAVLDEIERGDEFIRAYVVE